MLSLIQLFGTKLILRKNFMSPYVCNEIYSGLGSRERKSKIEFSVVWYKDLCFIEEGAC